MPILFPPVTVVSRKSFKYQHDTEVEFQWDLLPGVGGGWKHMLLRVAQLIGPFSKLINKVINSEPASKQNALGSRICRKKEKVTVRIKAVTFPETDLKQSQLHKRSPACASLYPPPKSFPHPISRPWPSPPFRHLRNLQYQLQETGFAPSVELIVIVGPPLQRSYHQ